MQPASGQRILRFWGQVFAICSNCRVTQTQPTKNPIMAHRTIRLFMRHQNFASLDFTAKKCDDFNLLVTETHK